MNELQVRERAQMTTGQLMSEWETISGKGLRSRTRLLIAMDAVEFCGILAERAHGHGVLRHPLPL
jgi:hypothetical protein